MTEPVAVCAPVGRDSAILLEILRGAEIACRGIDAAALPGSVAEASLAATVLTEEALLVLHPEQMRIALASQPPWSDLPFVVLTAKGSPRPGITPMLELLGNVVQVTRPLHPAAVVGLVRNALRARARQMEAFDYLQQVEAAERRLQDFAAGLERQIEHRTRALSAANRRLKAQSLQQAEAQDRLNQMQAELVHVSRVSAMGTMASTLAHELNQPLTAMANYLRGSIRLLQSHHAPTEDLDGLEHALASAHRAGEIVRRLRDFVSRGVVSRRPERVVTLIDEAIALGLVDAASAGIRCRTHVAKGVEWVLVDRVQIQQVLINLLRNAFEALTGADREREIVVTAAILNPSTVEIAVSDTGHGLSTEMKSTLFSSFKTTKPTGMGVGLSICRTIVEANGGAIVGENGPSGGAVFRFTLPTSDGDHSSSA